MNHWLVFGRDFIEERFGEYRYRISEGSFFSQIYPEAADLLIQQAIRLADFAGHERVLELYCGIGTISLPVAARSAHLRGVRCQSNRQLRMRVSTRRLIR